MDNYSFKLLQVAKTPTHRGAIFQMEADDKGLALIEAKVQSLKVYVLVDPDSDQIMEARFFTYGGPVFTALAETLCTHLQGSPVTLIPKIEVNELEKELRDEPDKTALPPDTQELEAVRALIAELDKGYPEKKNVALAARQAREASHYRRHTAEGRNEADKEWFTLDEVEKLRRIDDCLDKNVRQALHLDGGGLEILELVNGTKLRIRYQGACSGCGAATGGTLIFIENQLRENVYYNLSVEPEMPEWMAEPGISLYD
ncbi:MAG TPA: NifU family protein [Fibrobacteraceae bacterium]|nr:NifU family protein [Fibrobacteraceae bacterium]